MDACRWNREKGDGDDDDDDDDLKITTQYIPSQYDSSQECRLLLLNSLGMRLGVRVHSQMPSKTLFPKS